MDDPTGCPLVVVTGGSTGIGRERVREFTRNGREMLIAAQGQAHRYGLLKDTPS